MYDYCKLAAWNQSTIVVIGIFYEMTRTSSYCIKVLKVDDLRIEKNGRILISLLSVLYNLLLMVVNINFHNQI